MIDLSSDVDVRESEEFPEIDGEEGTVYFRRYGSNASWRTSPLLRADKGHIICSMMYEKATKSGCVSVRAR